MILKQFKMNIFINIIERNSQINKNATQQD